MDICSAPPPKPNVFHGRDDSVTSLVEKAIDHSTRQAAANLGILGKWWVRQDVFGSDRNVGAPYYGAFWSTSILPLVRAARRCDRRRRGIEQAVRFPTSKDTLREIITHLESHSRTLLVLDNLETVWLVPDDRARSQLELFSAAWLRYRR
ncbi:hypothetical protein BKA62DRAFT_158586 [Auriculariales sp. MPI-PUGE-AT-0066]|nr:hypothetical protein BKA62DRAFT_158586 [Auriculariales sp. MPI-PUGE-AT-0066]